MSRIARFLAGIAPLAFAAPAAAQSMDHAMPGARPASEAPACTPEHVQKLLRFTDDTLAKIAKIVGFSSEQYLSRVFKALEGISPREYRKRWK